MDNFDVYKDIQARPEGEIYIGVVGPVRTGKSTFIKRFMEAFGASGHGGRKSAEREQG